MADVEKVIEELEEARKCGNDNTPFMNEILDNAIQTIRELQEQNKWHLVADELPTGEQYRANNGQFIVTNGQRVYAEWFDIYDTKTFGEPTISRFRTDRSVIAWRELPKFEGVE